MQQVTIQMSDKTRLFNDKDFIAKFAERRDAPDSVNRCVDEPQILALLGDLRGLRVLEIGCGLGDLSIVLSKDAEDFLGIDISSDMVTEAIRRHPELSNCLISKKLNDVEKHPTYDIIVSSLAAHFVEDIESFFNGVYERLVEGGVFVFSQRHPVRTSNPEVSNGINSNDWLVKRYFEESKRVFTWLDCETHNYHRTLSTIFSSLRSSKFEILDLCEPTPIVADNSSDRLKECWHVPPIVTFKCRRLTKL